MTDVSTGWAKAGWLWSPRLLLEKTWYWWPHRSVSTLRETIAYRFSQLASEPRIDAAVLHYRKRKSCGDHALGEATLFASCSFSRNGGQASIGRIAGGTIALVAACTLAASAALAAGPEPGAILVQALPAPTPPHANTDLRSRIDSGPGLVAGERLNAGLLRRFYAAHGFKPVWATRQAQEDSLLKAVLRARDTGIVP